MNNAFILFDSVESVEGTTYRLHNVRMVDPMGIKYPEDTVGWRAYLQCDNVTLGIPDTSTLYRYKILNAEYDYTVNYYIFDIVGDDPSIDLTQYYPLSYQVYPICAPTINGQMGLPTMFGEIEIEGYFSSPSLSLGVISAEMRSTIDTSLLKDNVKYYEVGSTGCILGRVASKTLDNKVILASNNQRQTSNVVGVFLESKNEGEMARVLKFGAIPLGVIEDDDFVENVLPSDGEWVFLSSEDGKFSVNPPTDIDGSWQVFLGSWDNGLLNLHVVLWGQS